MAIVKYRIDGRMLHGQTCAAFGRVYSIDEYVVVNEKTSKDSMQKTLLQMAAMGNALTILSPENAKEMFESNSFKGKRTMVVFKFLEDAVKMVEMGYEIDELSIGGMFIDKAGLKQQKAMSLFVDDEDRKMFRYLVDKGIKITHQIVPDYKAKNIEDLVDF